MLMAFFTAKMYKEEDKEYHALVCHLKKMCFFAKKQIECECKKK